MGLQNELEKVQNRAARFVTGNYNFETVSMNGILEHLNTLTDGSLRKALAVNRMDSSFPNRWSFSYLKFVTNIIAKPKV